MAVQCRRICTLNSDYDIVSEKMVHHFIDRGFDELFVRAEFSRAKLLDRVSLLHKTLVEENSLKHANTNSDQKVPARCFPLVTTFNPRLPDANKILKSLKPILTIDKELASIFNTDKLFISFRKGKSIGDMLIHSRFPHHQIPSKVGSVKCGGCAVCNNYLVETDTFTSHHVNKTYKCTQLITCTTNYMHR